MELELILKYFAGKASPDEAIEVDEWTALNLSNKQFLEELHQSWLAVGENHYATPEIETAWQQFQSKVQPHNNKHLKQERFTPKLWLQTAAALVAICIISVAGYYVFNTENQNAPKLIAESTNKPLNVLLKDGSKVVLGNYSQLVYPKQFSDSDRAVTLVGDGQFEIAADQSKPFTIDLGKVTIKVLGTSFDVKRSKEAITVSVKKGKVAFYNKKDTLILEESAVGNYVKDKEKFELLKKSTVLPLTGSFNFENQNLSEVAQVLSNYFHTEIAIVNSSLGGCKLSGGYSNLTLEQILEGVATSLNLSYTIDQKKVTINGKGCK